MDSRIKKNLTNEEIKKSFKNSFDLVNYAISLAENMIKTGREPRMKSDTQNRALLILEEIRLGKDYLDEVEDKEFSSEETGYSYMVKAQDLSFDDDDDVLLEPAAPSHKE